MTGYVSGHSVDAPGLAWAASRWAFCDFALGRWNSAHAKATEVFQLVDETFAPSWFAAALLIHADIDSARGHDEPCRTACRRLRSIAETLDDVMVHVLADRSEGMLDLASQRLDLAVPRLETALATAAEAGLTHPYYSAAPDLVEAYLRQGRRREAEHVASGFFSAVGPGAPAPPRARALRLRALLAPRGEYDEDFDRSIALDGQTGLRFHAARTLLCHAERLRRDRRRVAAQARLLRCLDVFVALEAKPWVDRAEAELRACGGRARAASRGSVSELLTPQEMQIAVLVANGMRNREIAGTLFLSLRTVEFHLSRVFRKLEISSRTQLAARMTE